MPRTIPSALVSIIESSQNQPVELIELFLDSGTLFFAQSNDDIVFEGNTYSAMLFRRSTILTSVTEQVDVVTVGLDNVDKVLGQKLQLEEFRGKRCVIRKVFRENLGAGNSIRIFDGILDQPGIGEQNFSIRIRSKLDLVNKTFPGRVFSTLCNYRHYDPFCAVNREAPANKVTGVVAAGSDLGKLVATVLIDVDNYWKLGHVKFTSGVPGVIRIGRVVQSSNQGNTLVIYRIPLEIAPTIGDTFEIIRSCDKSPTDCIDKYNNFVNYGGFAHIPRPIIPVAVPSSGGGKKGGGGGKGGGK